MQRAEASSFAVYPVSQSRPIDSRAPAGKWGKMCACLAAFGRDGRSSLHVWVDGTVSSFGIVTSIGLMTACLFVWGMELDM